MFDASRLGSWHTKSRYTVGLNRAHALLSAAPSEVDRSCGIPGGPIKTRSSKKDRCGGRRVKKDERKQRWSLKGCVCGCEDTVSLTGAALSRRQFVAGLAGSATVAAAGVNRPIAAIAQGAGT